MRQILFHIPVTLFGLFPQGIPIYGFGMMLFLAFVICTWLACRQARKEGIAKEAVQDLSIWLFVAGIIGARLAFMIVERKPSSLEQFFSEVYRIWDGGLVYYGSLFGGTVGFFLAYYFVMRKQKIGLWQMADVIAPALAIGLCLGRIGCFLNGCCYGDVAVCEHCASVSYPFSAAPRVDYSLLGLQTSAGFTLRRTDLMVDAVAEGSPAEGADLRLGDLIVRINDREVKDSSDQILGDYLNKEWPRGQNGLTLTVLRGPELIELAEFYPRTIALHPTQLYESISTFLIFLALTAYYPFKHRHGAIMVLFFLLCPIHRFLDEMLRNDTPPVAFNMTFSQIGSIVLFLAAIGMAVLVWNNPPVQRPVAD